MLIAHYLAKPLMISELSTLLSKCKMIGSGNVIDVIQAGSKPHRSNNLHTVMQAAHPPSAGSNRNSMASLSRNNSGSNVLNTVRDDFESGAAEPVYATAPRARSRPVSAIYSHPTDGTALPAAMTISAAAQLRSTISPAKSAAPSSHEASPVSQMSSQTTQQTLNINSNLASRPRSHSYSSASNPVDVPVSVQGVVSSQGTNAKRASTAGAAQAKAPKRQSKGCVIM